MLAPLIHINCKISAATVTFSTPAKEQIIRESKVFGKGISWQTFQALLTHVGDARAWRIAYENGGLEIPMPYQEQEVPIIILASYFVNAIADELEIEAMQLGAPWLGGIAARDRTGHLFLHPASNFSYKQSCRESKFYSYHRN